MSLNQALRITDLAQLISGHGRGNDTLLAHITPREARLLKSAGGSGGRNPITGLLEFDDSGLNFEEPTIDPGPAPTLTEMPGGGYSGDSSYVPEMSAPITSSQDAGTQQYSSLSGVPSYDFSAPAGAAPATTSQPPLNIGQQVQSALSASAPAAAPAATPAPGGFSGKDIASLLGSGALAAYNIHRGQQQAGQQQKQIQGIAAPYKARANEYLNAAKTGDLLPSQRQSLAGLRAQAQQNLFNHGQGSGVAAQQAEAGIQQQAELFRENLMQTGLQLSGINDSLTLQAINAGYQADQDAQNAANKFFMSVFQALGKSGK